MIFVIPLDFASSGLGHLLNESMLDKIDIVRKKLPTVPPGVSWPLIKLDGMGNRGMVCQRC